MALTYNNTDRTLSIRGTITLTTGRTVDLTAADIRSYTIDEQSSFSGYALGSAESAHYELIISDVAHEYSPLLLNGATVAMQVGVLRNGLMEYSDFGKWKIDTCRVSKQNVTITLDGYDALNGDFDVEFSDKKSNYSRTIGALAQTVCNEAGVTLATTSFTNSGVSITSMPDWPSGTTLRGVIGYIAACAGGFARINRSGQLEFVTYGKSVNDTAITADWYITLDIGNGHDFSFNCLAVKNPGDEEFTRYAIDSGRVDLPTTAIQVVDNPLFTSTIANNLKVALTGLASSSVSLQWIGDPAVRVGDTITVMDVDDTTAYTVVVNAQTLIFDGGLSATTESSLPSEMSDSASYRVTEGVLDAAGMLNGNKLSVGSVQTEALAAGSVTAEKIAAGAISADFLAAGSITTDKLAAGAVTAEKMDTNTLKAVSIEAITAQLEQIATDKLTTDQLYAAFAKVMTLAVDEINAGTITTDELAAAMGKFVALYADTAGIDYAAIKDLVAGTAIITTGTAGELYIARLAVSEANIVNLSVGELLITGADGNLYALTVDDEGNVSATLRQVTNDDIADGTIDGGTKILSGSIVADNLNVAQIFGDTALINAVKAANIDVADLFANNAFITQLQTFDIWSNEYLRLAVRKDELETYMRLSDDGVDIGRTDSNVKMRLTNEEMDIIENGQTLASFSGSMMTVPRGVFTNALLLGNFALTPQANGGLTLLKR